MILETEELLAESCHIYSKLECVWKFIPGICTRHFAVYLGQIHLTQPAAPRSFGTNLPQSGTHSYQKAIFKHALVFHPASF